MPTLLIVFAVCLISILVARKCKTKIDEARLQKEEAGVPGATCADPEDLRDLLENGAPGVLSDILAGAIKDARRLGASSRDMMLLDCCQRHALAGDLEPGTAVYLLNRMGLGDWAEKAKGAGA